MEFERKLKFVGFSAGVFFFWAYGVIVFPGVHGQFGYETPNHLCGGHFRFPYGSIKFNHTTLTDPNPLSQKVCIWQIIPSPTYPNLSITVSNWSLRDGEKLGITGFTEFESELWNKTISGNEDPFPAFGDLIVVTLVSRMGEANTGGRTWGFDLSWERYSADYMRNNTRFVVVSNSYGEQSSRPPYYSHGFLGNSLSTFAFPKGNNTDGYSLRMEFWELTLQSDKENGTNWEADCPFWAGSDGPPNGFCNYFFVTKVTETGILEKVATFNNETVVGNEYRSSLGFFMVMWGGNRFNSTGGGRWTYEYNHVRG